jgi:hypothetical protein
MPGAAPPRFEAAEFYLHLWIGALCQLTVLFLGNLTDIMTAGIMNL